MIIFDLHNLFIEKNYNKIIDILYKNYDTIVSLTERTNNPQTNSKMDLSVTLSLYNSNKKLSDDDIKLIPIIIKKLIYHIVKESRELVFDGKTEFSRKINNKTSEKYYINVAKTPEKIKLFILYLLMFNYEAKYQYKNKNIYFAGIDYEFNNRKIALCQICLFPKKSDKYIWIIDPSELDKIQTNQMINTLFTVNYIYKILHGSDSLDIPYMFKELFDNNKDTILKFIRKVIDTRFICEFSKIITKIENKKCSIYDALLYFGTIDKLKYDNLEKTNKNMGPIQHINWNIHKMSTHHLKYALYDVLFLKEFLFDMLRKTKEYEYVDPQNLELIPEITRFVFLEKWDITTLLHDLKNDINKINNYTVNNFTLINIYQDVISNSFIKHLNLDIKDLLEINYFKSSLVTLFKYIIYSLISEQNDPDGNKYIIYENKNNIYDNKLNYTLILEHMKNLNFFRLHNLLRLFIKNSKDLISKFLL